MCISLANDFNSLHSTRTTETHYRQHFHFTCHCTSESSVDTLSNCKLVSKYIYECQRLVYLVAALFFQFQFARGAKFSAPINFADCQRRVLLAWTAVTRVQFVNIRPTDNLFAILFVAKIYFSPHLI